MDEFRLICYCISHFSMMGFLLVFTQRRFSFKKTAGILAAGFFALTGLEILHYSLGETGQTYYLIVMLQVLLLQSVAVFISDFRDCRALFTGLMSSNYVLPGVMSGSYIYVLTDWELASIVWEVLLDAGLLWMLCYSLRPVYMEVQMEDRGEWLGMCLMPALFYISATGLNLAVQDSGKPLHALITVMFFLATMYVSYVFVFQMIGKLYREQQAAREGKILKAGIRALRHELDELGETERKIAVHDHDRRHLIRIMQEMMTEKNYEGMKQILEQMQDMTEVRSPTHYTDNAPVNGVLVSYAAEAEKKKIAFLARLELPDSLRVNDWQLAVVIGNLLDNAILACEHIPDESDRRIRVTARRVREQVLVEIRNTCKAEVVFDMETGLPVSHRGENHGIGMHSVAYFAEKNQVTFDCGMDHGEFFARILI